MEMLQTFSNTSMYEEVLALTSLGEPVIDYCYLCSCSGKLGHPPARHALVRSHD